MENTTQEPYQDSPTSSRSSTPALENRSSIKPLPTLPVDTTPQSIEPYRDDPSDTDMSDSDSESESVPILASPTPQRYRATSELAHNRAQPPVYFVPYSDATPSTPQRHRSSTLPPHHHAHVQAIFIPYTDVVPEGDDDVPLAHLYPYPTEAPPSYHVAVRQSFRDTLIQHIPSNPDTETDEEAGVERERADDVRFTVERAVAGIIVSMVLLILAGFLALVALSFWTGRLG